MSTTDPCKNGVRNISCPSAIKWGSSEDHKWQEGFLNLIIPNTNIVPLCVTLSECGYKCKIILLTVYKVKKTKWRNINYQHGVFQVT